MVATGVAVAAVLATAPALATTWAVSLAAGSKGQATANTVPAAPTNVVATCSLVSLQITVTWNAVPHATSYTVYQSTSGANGTYSAVATGVTATTWTSGILLLGTYYYKVTATYGTTWEGAQSAATAGHTITLVLCT